jgi:putative membrane protein insertion efficiency factor
MSSGLTSNRKETKSKLAFKLILLAIFILLAADSQLPSRRQISAKTAILSIQLYQQTAGKLLRGARICKFTPSCSNYGIMALQKYGFFKGAAKTIGRIVRCSPFTNDKGVDYP